MSADLHAKLKTLQYQRSESSPFASHIEFHIWADNVTPLLSFDPKLQSQFKNIVSASDTSRIFKIKGQEIENINTAIGLLNQAIKSLEINSIPNTTSNPTSNPTNNIDGGHRPIVGIWVSAIATILAAMIIYLLRHHLGISL